MLGVDVISRERGLYKVRRTSQGDIRAIQVMGVDLVSPGSEPGIPKERRILLGCGFPDASSLTEGHALFQQNAKWSESSWESGVEYCR